MGRIRDGADKTLSVERWRIPVCGNATPLTLSQSPSSASRFLWLQVTGIRGDAGTCDEPYPCISGTDCADCGNCEVPRNYAWRTAWAGVVTRRATRQPARGRFFRAGEASQRASLMVLERWISLPPTRGRPRGSLPCRRLSALGFVRLYMGCQVDHWGLGPSRKAICAMRYRGPFPYRPRGARQ